MGPRTRTKRRAPSALASAGASGRHNEPGSRPASTCPAQQPIKAGGDSPRGGGRHHGDGKADRSTDSDLTRQRAAHQRGATRHAREARRRPQPRHKDRCQATTATGAANPGSAHNTRRTAARDKVPRTAGPACPHTAPTASGKRAPAARPKGLVVGGGRAPDPGHPTLRQEAPPPGTLMPPPQHASARAVGLVTGPHACTPRTHSKWVVGPGCTPERTRGRGWESARPRTPHTV